MSYNNVMVEKKAQILDPRMDNEILLDLGRSDVFEVPIDQIVIQDEHYDKKFVDYLIHGRKPKEPPSEEDIENLSRFVGSLRYHNNVATDVKHAVITAEEQTLENIRVAPINTDLSESIKEETDTVEPLVQVTDVPTPQPQKKPKLKRTPTSTQRRLHYRPPITPRPGEDVSRFSRPEHRYNRGKLWKESDLNLYLSMLKDERRYILSSNEFPEEIDVGVIWRSRMHSFRDKSQTSIWRSPRAAVPIIRSNDQWVICHGMYTEDKPVQINDRQFAIAFSNPLTPEDLGDNEYRGFYRADIARILKGNSSFMLAIDDSRLYALFRASDSDYINPESSQEYLDSIQREPGLLKSISLMFTRRNLTPDMAAKHGLVLYQGQHNGIMKRVTPE